MPSIADLKIGQKAVIADVALDNIPLKLLEMGCIPGKKIELLQKAPLNDPLYIKVNGSYLAIRTETAASIQVIMLQ